VDKTAVVLTDIKPLILYQKPCRDIIKAKTTYLITVFRQKDQTGAAGIFGDNQYAVMKHCQCSRVAQASGEKTKDPIVFVML
jgi:hypothetical protein